MDRINRSIIEMGFLHKALRDDLESYDQARHGQRPMIVTGLGRVNGGGEPTYRLI